MYISVVAVSFKHQQHTVYHYTTVHTRYSTHTQRTQKLVAITKTSPYGTVEHPFNPGSLVLGAKGTFFARGMDTELALNQEIMLAASRHKGTSVMEFLTNCVIFNNGSHAEISDSEHKADRTLVLRDGEKMYEELLMDEESTLPTDNQSIMISTGQEISYDQVASKLDELENALSATDGEAIRMLEQAVPTYHYTSNGKGIV